MYLFSSYKPIYGGVQSEDTLPRNGVASLFLLWTCPGFWPQNPPRTRPTQPNPTTLLGRVEDPRWATQPDRTGTLDKTRKPSKTSRDSIIKVRIEKKKNLLIIKERRYGNYTVSTLSQRVIEVNESI